MYVLAATNERTSREDSLEANERLPNTEGEFAGRKTMWSGAQCAQCHGNGQGNVQNTSHHCCTDNQKIRVTPINRKTGYIIMGV